MQNGRLINLQQDITNPRVLNHNIERCILKRKRAIFAEFWELTQSTLELLSFYTKMKSSLSQAQSYEWAVLNQITFICKTMNQLH